ncbi:hypothetical protein [uncultured Gelidibacter sp.]|uniref:hypothetical protein n=1 Tax=uncultured Gelidibacter sp. TaxID=259318 RepID=UPI0026389E4C|nr:hypothetical protein [uncultured Gelidibacter sp.]
MRFKICVKLDNNYVLWFESSNQYIVVSALIKDLLDVYFQTANKSSFIYLLGQKNISQADALSYYQNIHNLITSSNSTVKETSVPESIFPKKSVNTIKHYKFGNIQISVSYSSLEIENLIHPQWSHTAVDHNPNPSVSFHILKDENNLFLVRNEKCIGYYHTDSYHLLQGQFALQIINTLYNKTESDWIATFHASTVCNENEAIMIIGASGNGKSTLSAVLMDSGIDVLADDFTPLLAKDKMVYRYPSGISVKQGAFEMLNQLYSEFEKFPLYKSTSKKVNVKYIPPVKDFESGIPHLPCKKIVYVKYDSNGQSSLNKVRTEKILETLVPESWISPLASNAKLFLEWIKELQCYELTYSDNDIAVSKFNELFQA